MKESSYIEIFSLVLLFYLLSGFIAPEQPPLPPFPITIKIKATPSSVGNSSGCQL